METPKIIDLNRNIDVQYIVLHVQKFELMLGADKRRVVMEDTSCASLVEALDEAYSLYRGNEKVLSLISVDLRTGETKTLYNEIKLYDLCAEREEQESRPAERPPYTHGHGF